MTDSTNEKIFSQNCDNCNTFFESLVRNLNNYLDSKKMSLREFSERTDIPLETIRSIVYGKTNTCKFNTAVKIARQLGITVDELINSGLVEREIAEELKLVRSFSHTEKQLLRWYVKKIYRRHQKFPGKKMVTIMIAACSNGTLKSTNDYIAKDITNLPDNVSDTAFFGIVVPCEHYMPHYAQGNIILVSADRKPRLGEHCVVSIDNNIYIVAYHEEGGNPKLKSIINRRLMPFESRINDIIGYVSYVFEE